jgi:hypothetical protein
MDLRLVIPSLTQQQIREQIALIHTQTNEAINLHSAKLRADAAPRIAAVREDCAKIGHVYGPPPTFGFSFTERSEECLICGIPRLEGELADMAYLEDIHDAVTLALANAGFEGHAEVQRTPDGSVNSHIEASFILADGHKGTVTFVEGAHRTRTANFLGEVVSRRLIDYFHSYAAGDYVPGAPAQLVVGDEVSDVIDHDGGDE